ncbi:hypothetical protein ACP70R_008419 [Stipagrostis hirtigluma subsp. patula]
MSSPPPIGPPVQRSWGYVRDGGRMGAESAGWGSPEQVTLWVRELIRRHFELHG